MKTLKEAAAIIGTTPDNLRGAIARGALKAERVGDSPSRSLWLVSDREVERYRTQHSRAGRELAPQEPPSAPRRRGRPRKVQP